MDLSSVSGERWGGGLKKSIMMCAAVNDRLFYSILSSQQCYDYLGLNNIVLRA